jgi:hypothetical protein
MCPIINVALSHGKPEFYNFKSYTPPTMYNFVKYIEWSTKMKVEKTWPSSDFFPFSLPVKFVNYTQNYIWQNAGWENNLKK